MIRQLNEAFDKLNNTSIKSNKTVLESLQEAEEFEESYPSDFNKLQEKLPADLAKAYDRNDLYKDRTSRYRYNDKDFEKAEYKDITQDEEL